MAPHMRNRRRILQHPGIPFSKIDGLWGIAFGNRLSHQPVDTLFFTAGPNDEQNCLDGRLDVAP
jgi:hypothetical protein